MTSPEFEKPPREFTPVRRYYGLLRNHHVDYAGYIIAAEKLLDDEGLGDEGRTYEDLYGIALPTHEFYESNKKSAMNMLTILPIEVVAPWVDATMEADKIKAWYSVATLQIQASSKTHPKSCFALRDGESMKCDHSDVCPCQLISRELQLPVLEPDFESVEYMLDPYRARQIALDKMEVAFERKIISERPYVAAVSKFSVDFESHFEGESLLDENEA